MPRGVTISNILIPFLRQASLFLILSSRFEVQGSRFRVQGSGFKVQGSRFKVLGSGFKVLCSQINVSHLISHISHLCLNTSSSKSPDFEGMFFVFRDVTCEVRRPSQSERSKQINILNLYLLRPTKKHFP